MKATLLQLVLIGMLSFPAYASEAITEAPERPVTQREYFLATCTESLAGIQDFVKEHKVRLMYRFYDKQKGMIIQTYATTDGTYTLEIGIVATGKACILHEGFMFKDLRGFES